MTDNKKEMFILSDETLSDLQSQLFILRMNCAKKSLLFSDIPALSNFYDEIELDLQKIIRKILLKLNVPVID